MKRTIALLLLAPAAIAASPAPPLTHYEAQTTPPAPPAAARKDELATGRDPFERMTVAVSLGGPRQYRFLVDTGADRTTVSSEVVRELGLEQRQKAVLHSASGPSLVRMAYLPEIRMSERAVRNINAPVLDAEAMGADGILGIDSLRSQQVVFDFAKSTIAIYSSQASAVVDRDAIVVRAKRRAGRLVLTNADIEGRKVGAMLDTGASLTVGNLALRSELARRGMLKSVAAISLLSVTGEALTGELAVVKSLDIGGVRLEGLSVVFADSHAFRQLQMDKKPAVLLGMNALRGFDQVAIDFADRRLSLVLPRKRGTLPA